MEIPCDHQGGESEKKNMALDPASPQERAERKRGVEQRGCLTTKKKEQKKKR